MEPTSFENHRALAFEIGKRGVAVLAILCAALVALRVLRAFRSRAERRLIGSPHRDVGEAEHRQRIETVLRVASDVARAGILLAAGIALLGQAGVSVQPFVAGAGLAGAALALGSQTIVKDFVSGFFILLEGHFAIGDEVSVGGGLAGTVERMTLRVTILRDADGAVHIVPNGLIGSVTNRSYHWTAASVEIAVDAKVEPTRVREALTDAVAGLSEKFDEMLSDPAVEGPVALKGPTTLYRVRVRTIPHGVGRAQSIIIEHVTRSLAARDIEIKA